MILELDMRIIFGNSTNLSELKDESVQLVVTSPPYYNAPFDYPGLFESYPNFLDMIKNCANELKRVLSKGRIAAFVVDDTLINGEKFPVVADITKIFVNQGFKYRERITWVKPEGYIRISKRSGVILQHPYPMYYYPDNLQESILIFQNGNFNYKSISEKIRELSTIDKNEFQKNKWYLSVWNITNVLPRKNRLEKGIAAFPEEIPYRLIKLFSYHGETVLDPFLGSGTTIKVAKELKRKSVGYEIDLELLEIIKLKIGIDDSDIIRRRDAKRLRTKLQNNISKELIRMKRSSKINARSPLRYPGGKSRALKSIIPNIYPSYKEFREPFVGGGSVFLAAKQRINPKAIYKINDLNYDVYCFWNELKENGKLLINAIKKIKAKFTNGRKLFETLTISFTEKPDLDRAIRFFILNRITFSGTTDSGGYSKQAFEKRFTETSIQRLEPLPKILEHVIIEFGDYEKLLNEPGEDVFIFLDPPYYSSTKSKLYGKKGDLHTTFNHEIFSQKMKKCKHKWLITYDDCPEIQDLYSFSNTYFYKWNIKYGMTNAGGNLSTKGKELMISNYPLPPTYKKRLDLF